MIDRGRICGIVAEVDLLNHILVKGASLDSPIRPIIEADYQTVTPQTKVRLLKTIFNDAKMVCVLASRPGTSSEGLSPSKAAVPSDSLLGVITKIDHRLPGHPPQLAFPKTKKRRSHLTTSLSVPKESRTLMSRRTRDFESPASAIPPLRRGPTMSGKLPQVAATPTIFHQCGQGRYAAARHRHFHVHPQVGIVGEKSGHLDATDVGFDAGFDVLPQLVFHDQVFADFVAHRLQPTADVEPQRLADFFFSSFPRRARSSFRSALAAGFNGRFQVGHRELVVDDFRRARINKSPSSEIFQPF